MAFLRTTVPLDLVNEFSFRFTSNFREVAGGFQKFTFEADGINSSSERDVLTLDLIGFGFVDIDPPAGRLTRYSTELSDGSGLIISDFNVDLIEFLDLRQVGGHESAFSLVARGADRFIGSAGADNMRSYGGNDVVDGRGGADNLRGDGGNDRIFGREGNDTLSGGGGEDRLVGGRGDDLFLGGGGADVILGGSGADQARAGGGDDRLVMGGGSDEARGANGADDINGGGGADDLRGGGGDDTLNGSRGADTLSGDGGSDVLTGGGGSDLFVFRGATEDRITDFEIGRDTVDVTVLGAFDGFQSFAAFEAANIIATEDGAEIRANGALVVLLEGIEAADLTDGDILF